MIQYKLVLTKSDSASRSLLLVPVDLKKLNEPLHLKREEKAEQPETESYRNIKKKSEAVEYVDEEYKRLSEEESQPLVLEDAEGRGFKGRLQSVKNTQNNYFVFINTGKAFKVIPVSKWYRFTQKINYDTLTLEEAESKIGKDDDRWMMHKKKEEEVEEIDYEEVFDDDDGEEAHVADYEEKKQLSSSGKELKKFMRSLEESEEQNEKGRKEEKKEMMKLSEGDLVQMIMNDEMSIKELLSRIKVKFKIDEYTKKLVQRFIKERCEYKKEVIDGEKVYKLKLK